MVFGVDFKFHDEIVFDLLKLLDFLQMLEQFHINLLHPRILIGSQADQVQIFFLFKSTSQGFTGILLFGIVVLLFQFCHNLPGEVHQSLHFLRNLDVCTHELINHTLFLDCGLRFMLFEGWCHITSFLDPFSLFFELG